MKRVISWVQSIKLKQIITVFLVGLTFLIGTGFDMRGNQLQAQAEPVTPEATQYKVDTTETEAEIKADRIEDNAKKSAKLLEDEGINIKNKTADEGKNIFENIKNKLNLDEPIDPGTKKAGEQLKEAAEDVIKAPQKALKDISK